MSRTNDSQDVAISLTPKAFETLLYFVENPQRLLTKNELIAKLWPDSFVEESNLAQNVSALRRALGESPSETQFIETVPKLGYRFVADVREIRQEAKAPAFAVANGVIANSANEFTFTETDLNEIPATHARAVTPEAVGVAPPAGSRTRWYAFAALCGVLLIGALYFFTRGGSSLLPNRQLRLAVLPLVNQKPDPNTDYLGFTLADAVITKLNYVTSLVVRPSAYVERYRQQRPDPQQVAQELSVNRLLTGTYLKEGDQLNLNLQLINLDNNQALWTESLTLPADKLITLQERVSQEIVARMALRLSDTERAELKSDLPQNPLAYEFHLRGVDLYVRDELATAQKMLEKAVELDPQYATSWAYLCATYSTLASLYFGGEAMNRQAQHSFDRALALAPHHIEAKTYKSMSLTETNRVEEAVPLLRDVLQTNPNLAQAHWQMAYLLRFAGRLKESIASAERSRQIDDEIRSNNAIFASLLYDGQYERYLKQLPSKETAYILFYRGFGHYYQKDYAEAVKLFDRAYEMVPALMQAQVGKALSFSVSGNKEAGLALLQQTAQQIETRGVTDAEGVYKVAQAFAVLGDKTTALKLWRRSVEGGFFCYPYFANDPLLANLRDAAEYAEVLALARQRHEAFGKKFF
ncbi:MAG: tetratricopeptide repeat protein [Acidobacteria bacterium]|nr:tetratricopeptide repeat protein [Acidobacteriota bacterium]